MKASDTPRIKGDRALSRGDTDRLGFREVAEGLARALTDHITKDGLVVGIEGEWGSGKSSLLYLCEAAINDVPSEQRPTTIHFKPWLVGNRDLLLAYFFNELTRAIEAVAAEKGDHSPETVTKAKETATKLRKFAGGLGTLAPLVKLAGDASGIAPLSWTGKGLSALGELASGESAEPPLAELKEDLVQNLSDLDHRFIVTIDDVDRLEPSEVVEVLRLVRSVGDFPNVIYLLCYDSSILAHAIEQAAKVESGRAYLEKIVQLTVMVPRPEPFQLRHWFAEDLLAIANPKNDDERDRLRYVIDQEGARQLTSPRSVVRVLDAIRFFWPALREAGADLSDLVWLQLVKEGNPRLYRWIESYCGTAAELSIGTAMVDNTAREKELAALIETVEKNYFENNTYRFYFADQLPGLKANFVETKDAFDLFQDVPPQCLTSAPMGQVCRFS